MSSAILYAAIVAIWAGVLVPRWLRQRSALPRPGEPLPVPGDAPVADLAGPPPEETAEPGGAGPSADRLAAVAPPGAEKAPVPGPSRAAPPGVLAPASRPRPGRPIPAPAGPQASVLRSRRRMLAALVLLTAAAATLTMLHAAPRWVAVPPALMLAGFLLLLRAAAHADSGRLSQRAPAAPAQARRVAGQNERRASPLPVPAVGRSAWQDRPAAAAAPPPPRRADAPGTTAQVIDISGRLGDQLYDQYADAAERAVGD